MCARHVTSVGRQDPSDGISPTKTFHLVVQTYLLVMHLGAVVAAGAGTRNHHEQTWCEDCVWDAQTGCFWEKQKTVSPDGGKNRAPLAAPDASQPSHSLFNIEGLQRCTTGRLPESKTGWWLTYPSEKYESQLGWWFPIYGKMKNVPNHQPATLIRGEGGRHCLSATAMRALVQDDVGYSNSIL